MMGGVWGQEKLLQNIDKQRKNTALVPKDLKCTVNWELYNGLGERHYNEYLFLRF